MTTAHATAGSHPWVEVTERSDGHVMPFLTGIVLFVATAVISILLSGLPY